MAMDQSHSFDDEKDDNDLFVDSVEDVSSGYCSCMSSPLAQDTSFDENCVHSLAKETAFEAWTTNLDSINDRRDKFRRMMGLSFRQKKDPISLQKCDVNDCQRTSPISVLTTDEKGRILSTDSNVSSRASIPRTSSMASPLDSQPSSSRCSTERSSVWEDDVSEGSVEYTIKNLDDSNVFVINHFNDDGSPHTVRELGSNDTFTATDFSNKFSSSTLIQDLMRRESSSSTESPKNAMKERLRWLKKLAMKRHIVPDKNDESNSSHTGSTPIFKKSLQRVKVHVHRKNLREFSAVYKGIDIKAHDGSILTLKFNCNGKYLASGGEDGVVRIWRIIQSEISNDYNFPQDDPSCIYFMSNENLELTPLSANLEKGHHITPTKAVGSTCVVIPPRTFWISDEPVHEFHGHGGDVLAVAWSNNEYLLSSSSDKAVCLWQIGCRTCLKVFPHNSVVTCVQFKHDDENYFVSGSVDGIVRIWKVSIRRVVGWIDIKEIVTAVCYHPDGKRVVVGTMTGDCCFYNVSADHQLQLESRVPLQGKKKSTAKSITNLQFSPIFPERLLVTCADSQVCLLDGVRLIANYKGLRNTSNLVAASFAADGQRIISAGGDFNIYIWNNIDMDDPKSKNIESISSYEHFASDNVCIAIPWNISLINDSTQRDASADSDGADHDSQFLDDEDSSRSDLHYRQKFGNFTVNRALISDYTAKESATWSEEKSSTKSTTGSTLQKQELYALRASSKNPSPLWAQVTVTAGWDGHIRSFHNFGLPEHH